MGVAQLPPIGRGVCREGSGSVTASLWPNYPCCEGIPRLQHDTLPPCDTMWRIVAYAFVVRHAHRFFSTHVYSCISRSVYMGTPNNQGENCRIFFDCTLHEYIMVI